MSRETSDKDEEPSTAASAKPRALPGVPVSSARAIPTTLDPSEPPPPGPVQSPAAIADGEPSPAATADRNLAAENAEVEAILDAWARGPQTPQATHELRARIKRARSTSDARDSPTP